MEIEGSTKDCACMGVTLQYPASQIPLPTSLATSPYMCIPMPWPDAYCLHGYAATGYVATGYMATWLRAISMTTFVPDYTKRERVARQSLLALRARALAKFGEVDAVPVSENSLKSNTFC